MRCAISEFISTASRSRERESARRSRPSRAAHPASRTPTPGIRKVVRQHALESGSRPRSCGRVAMEVRGVASNSELAAKHERLATWLTERDAHAVLLLSKYNVAWMACGGEFLRPDTPLGFVVTGDRCVLLCPSDDTDRVR